MGSCSDDCSDDLRRAWEFELADALGQAAVGVHLIGRDGIILYANQTELEMLGYSRDDYVGCHASKFYVDQPVIAGLLDCLRRGETVSRCPVRLRSRDGFVRDILVTANAVLVNDQLEYARCFTLDVTEQKRAEQALRDSEQRFTRFMQHFPGLAWIKDLEGRYVYANEAALAAFQRPQEELYGKTDEEVFPPETAAHFRENDRRALTSEAGVRVIETLEHADDMLHHSVVSKFPILGASGLPVMVGGMAVDITKRKQIEAELQAREVELELIAETTPLILTRCSCDLKYRFVNRAAAALFGLTPDQLVGKSIVDIMGEETFLKIRPYVQQVLQGHKVEFEAELAYTGVGSRWVRATYVPDCNEQGEVVGWMASIVDVTERKRMEEELRQSEQRYRAIVETQSEMVCRFRRDGTLLFVNGPYARAQGRTPEALIGANLWDFVAEVDRHHVEEMLDRLRPDSPVVQIENQLETAHGTRWTLWTNVGLSFGADGHVTEAQSSGIDITRRKQAELTLHDSEERLRMALDAGRMGIWEWHIPTGKILWSPTLEAIHGLPPGGFAGTFEAYQHDMHPEDRLRVLETIHRTVQERRDHHLEYRIIWPDRSVHWVEGRGKLYVDGSAQPERMIGVCVDITERKRLEESLRFLAAASKSLASLMDYKSTLPQLACLAVPAFADFCTVDMLNERGSIERLAVAHTDPKKVELGYRLNSRYPPDPHASRGVMHVLRTGAAEMERSISRFLLEEAAQDDEHLKMLQELDLKSYICVPLTVKGRTLGVLTFIMAESGRHYGPDDLAMAEDLAHRTAIAIENARLYQEVRDADRRKDEFLAMLAHEIRNPLAPIRTGLELMKMLKDPVEVEETRRRMERQTQQLITLVDDLLDVSRITRGKLKLRRCQVNLADVVQSAVEASRHLVDDAGHELTLSMPEEQIILDADPHRLAQVISNLVNNAAKYTPEGGQVWLTVRRLGSSAVVSVEDTGIGIPEDMQEQIFQMFTQIPGSPESDSTGLGIGLTLVKQLVEMHGGTVQVASGGVGKGSKFSVRLPIMVNPGEIRTDSQLAESAVNQLPLRILVVDDNKVAADMLGMVVNMLGNEARTAYNGEEAVTVAANYRPDVILMDLGMPKMSGFEAARRIREQEWGRSVFLVALTGWGQDEDKQRTAEAGFAHHLVKPADPDDLKRLFAQLAAAVR